MRWSILDLYLLQLSTVTIQLFSLSGLLLITCFIYLTNYYLFAQANGIEKTNYRGQPKMGLLVGCLLSLKFVQPIATLHLLFPVCVLLWVFVWNRHPSSTDPQSSTQRQITHHMLQHTHISDAYTAVVSHSYHFIRTSFFHFANYLGG